MSNTDLKKQKHKTTTTTTTSTSTTIAIAIASTSTYSYPFVRLFIRFGQIARKAERKKAGKNGRCGATSQSVKLNNRLIFLFLFTLSCCCCCCCGLSMFVNELFRSKTQSLRLKRQYYMLCGHFWLQKCNGNVSNKTRRNRQQQ